MPGNEPYDWADDDSMSAEETLRRFRALDPKPTTGPPAGNYFVSFDSGLTTHVVSPTDAAFAPWTHQEPLTLEPVPASATPLR